MKSYAGWLLLIAFVAAGYYLYAVNPTPYEVIHKGPHEYRRSRMDDKWQVKAGGTWKDMKTAPAEIDPARRLGDVGIEGFH